MAAALSEKVQRVLNQKFDDIKHSSNELLLKQSRLKDGTENITGSISCLKNDIVRILSRYFVLNLKHSKCSCVFAYQSSIKSCIEAIKKSNTETEFWIEINQGKDINNLSADELIMPRDTWSKQLIENAAMDHAIEDTFYELDDALNKGLINLEEFLKHTRRLGREQFFARALAMKIHEKQQSEN